VTHTAVPEAGSLGARVIADVFGAEPRRARSAPDEIADTEAEKSFPLHVESCMSVDPLPTCRFVTIMPLIANEVPTSKHATLRTL